MFMYIFVWYFVIYLSIITCNAKKKRKQPTRTRTQVPAFWSLQNLQLFLPQDIYDCLGVWQSSRGSMQFQSNGLPGDRKTPQLRGIFLETFSLSADGFFWRWNEISLLPFWGRDRVQLWWTWTCQNWSSHLRITVFSWDHSSQSELVFSKKLLLQAALGSNIATMQTSQEHC